MTTFTDLGISVNGHTSGQVSTTCPRCSHERRKSGVACLSVNIDEGLYNCFAGETRVLTQDGVFPIQELAGSNATVLSSDGKWRSVPFMCFGEQELISVYLSRTGAKKVIRATPDHRWFVRGKTRQTFTADLLKGQRLIATFPRYDGTGLKLLLPWIQRGFIFGDGTYGNGKKNDSHAYFCGEKIADMLPYFPGETVYHYESTSVITKQPADGKLLPSLESEESELWSWLSGYFAADGNVGIDGMVNMSCARKDVLEYVRTLCSKIGIGTYGIGKYNRMGINDVFSDIYCLRFLASSLSSEFFLRPRHYKNFISLNNVYERQRWQVEKIERQQEYGLVYCCVVPDAHNFVLEDNILTSNCHHCGWSGGLKDERPYTPLMRQATRKVYRKPAPPVPKLLPPSVFKWFATRGIPESVVTRRGVTYSSRYCGTCEREVGMVGFPYIRDGELVNVQYRDGQKHFTLEAGAELLFYGMDDIDGDTLYIVEGQMDAMALEVAGYQSVVSVPNGAPDLNAKHYERHFAFLEGVEAQLQQVKRIILAVDTDAPGLKLADELARRLGPERCARVQWSGDCKDANDVLISEGVEVLKECVEHATPWPVSGIVTVDQLLPDLSYMYDHGMERGERTGWYTLDRHYTVRSGEWTLITGVPSHGKSTFLDALMLNLARQSGWRFAVYSPENHPLKRYTARLLENHTGKPFDGVPDPQRMTREEMGEGAGWLNQHVSYLMPDEADPTVDHLLDLARIQVYRHGIKGLILDPWNEMESGEDPKMPDTKAISKALARIRRFAQLHDVHVWLVAHPTKLRKAEKGQYEGLYPPPTPYDVSGSANFRNKPDAILCIWRDVEGVTFPQNRVEVHIQKIRFREIGTVGMVELTYDPACRRYHERPVEVYPWKD